MTDIIRHDIDKRIHDKLRLWIRDSYALYEMAELDHAHIGVFAALLNAYVGGCMALEMSEGQALRVAVTAIQKAYGQARADSHGS